MLIELLFFSECFQSDSDTCLQPRHKVCSFQLCWDATLQPKTETVPSSAADGKDKLLEWPDLSCLLLYVSARIHLNIRQPSPKNSEKNLRQPKNLLAGSFVSRGITVYVNDSELCIRAAIYIRSCEQFGFIIVLFVMLFLYLTIVPFNLQAPEFSFKFQHILYLKCE